MSFKTSRNFCEKTISILLISCLIVPNSSYPVPVENPSTPPQIQISPKEQHRELKLAADFAALTISEELGRVELVKPATRGETVATPHSIIHIRDAHGSYEAQRNIEKIIEQLVRETGIRTILVEGAIGELRPELFRFFKDHSANQKIADQLARYGEFTGSELFLLDPVNARDTQGIGVENLSAYAANLKTFRRVLGQQSKSDRFIRGMRRQIEMLGSRLLNKTLRDFLRLWQSWREDRLPLSGFLEGVKERADQTLEIDLLDAAFQNQYPMLIRYFKAKRIEPGLHPDLAAEEKKKLLGSLPSWGVSEDVITTLTAWQTEKGMAGWPDGLPRAALEALYDQAVPRGFRFADYPELMKLWEMLIFQSEIEGEPLFLELDHLNHELFTALAGNEQEKKLIRMIQDSVLLEKLLHLEVTRDEIKIVEAKQTELRPSAMLARLNTWNKLVRIPVRGMKAVDAIYHQALRFYDGAIERERFLVQNAKAALNSRGETSAILVTGGFHSEGLQKAFTDQDFSYAEISPRMNSIDGIRETYVTAMLDERRTIFDRAQISRIPNMITASEFLAIQRGMNAGPEAGALLRRVRSTLDVIIGAEGGSPAIDRLRELAESPYARDVNLHVAQSHDGDRLTVGAYLTLNGRNIPIFQSGTRLAKEITITERPVLDVTALRVPQASTAHNPLAGFAKLIPSTPGSKIAEQARAMVEDAARWKTWMEHAEPANSDRQEIRSNIIGSVGAAPNVQLPAIAVQKSPDIGKIGERRRREPHRGSDTSFDQRAAVVEIAGLEPESSGVEEGREEVRQAVPDQKLETLRQIVDFINSKPAGFGAGLYALSETLPPASSDYSASTQIAAGSYFYLLFNALHKSVTDQTQRELDGRLAAINEYLRQAVSPDVQLTIDRTQPRPRIMMAEINPIVASARLAQVDQRAAPGVRAEIRREDLTADSDESRNEFRETTEKERQEIEQRRELLEKVASWLKLPMGEYFVASKPKDVARYRNEWSWVVASADRMPEKVNLRDSMSLGGQVVVVGDSEEKVRAEVFNLTRFRHLDDERRTWDDHPADWPFRQMSKNQYVKITTVKDVVVKKNWVFDSSHYFWPKSIYYAKVVKWSRPVRDLELHHVTIDPDPKNGTHVRKETLPALDEHKTREPDRKNAAEIENFKRVLNVKLKVQGHLLKRELRHIKMFKGEKGFPVALNAKGEPAGDQDDVERVVRPIKYTGDKSDRFFIRLRREKTGRHPGRYQGAEPHDHPHLRFSDFLKIVAERVGRAHAIGLIHNDLGISNLLIKDKEIVILDWMLSFLRDTKKDMEEFGKQSGLSSADITTIFNDNGIGYKLKKLGYPPAETLPMDETRDFLGMAVLVLQADPKLLLPIRHDDPDFDNAIKEIALDIVRGKIKPKNPKHAMTEFLVLIEQARLKAEQARAERSQVADDIQDAISDAIPFADESASAELLGQTPAAAQPSEEISTPDVREEIRSGESQSRGPSQSSSGGFGGSRGLDDEWAADVEKEIHAFVLDAGVQLSHMHVAIERYAEGADATEIADYHEAWRKIIEPVHELTRGLQFMQANRMTNPQLNLVEKLAGQIEKVFKEVNDMETQRLAGMNRYYLVPRKQKMEQSILEIEKAIVEFEIQYARLWLAIRNLADSYVVRMERATRSLRRMEEKMGEIDARLIHLETMTSALARAKSATTQTTGNRFAADVRSAIDGFERQYVKLVNYTIHLATYAQNIARSSVTSDDALDHSAQLLRAYVAYLNSDSTNQIETPLTQPLQRGDILLHKQTNRYFVFTKQDTRQLESAEDDEGGPLIDHPKSRAKPGVHYEFWDVANGRYERDILRSDFLKQSGEYVLVKLKTQADPNLLIKFPLYPRQPLKADVKHPRGGLKFDALDSITARLGDLGQDEIPFLEQRLKYAKEALELYEAGHDKNMTTVGDIAQTVLKPAGFNLPAEKQTDFEVAISHIVQMRDIGDDQRVLKIAGAIRFFTMPIILMDESTLKEAAQSAARSVLRRWGRAEFRTDQTDDSPNKPGDATSSKSEADRDRQAIQQAMEQVQEAEAAASQAATGRPPTFSNADLNLVGGVAAALARVLDRLEKDLRAAKRSLQRESAQPAVGAPTPGEDVSFVSTQLTLQGRGEKIKSLIALMREHIQAARDHGYAGDVTVASVAEEFQLLLKATATDTKLLRTPRGRIDRDTLFELMSGLSVSFYVLTPEKTREFLEQEADAIRQAPREIQDGLREFFREDREHFAETFQDLPAEKDVLGLKSISGDSSKPADGRPEDDAARPEFRFQDAFADRFPHLFSWIVVQGVARQVQDVLPTEVSGSELFSAAFELMRPKVDAASALVTSVTDAELAPVVDHIRQLIATRVAETLQLPQTAATAQVTIDGSSEIAKSLLHIFKPLSGQRIKIAVADNQTFDFKRAWQAALQVIRRDKSLDAVARAQILNAISSMFRIENQPFGAFASRRAGLATAFVEDESVVGTLDLSRLTLALVKWDGIRPENRAAIELLLPELLTAGDRLAKAARGKSASERAEFHRQLETLGFSFEELNGTPVVALYLNQLQKLVENRRAEMRIGAAA